MSIVAACAMGVALALPVQGVAAQIADAWTWARAEAGNGVYSIETPCAAAELAEAQAMPIEAFANLKFLPDSRIICLKGDTLLVAGVAEAPDAPADAASAFDTLVATLNSDVSGGSKPVLTTLAGRRAMVNREQKGGKVAQVGIIELSRTQLLILIGGTDDASLSVAAQGEMLDRFYASLKVAAK